MTQLCFASFAKCLQSAMQPPNDDKDVVDILLNWITDKDSVVDKKGNPINLAPSLISDLINRKVDVPRAIKNACTSAAILSEAVTYFDARGIPFLNPYMADDMYENLIKAVQDDVDMAARKKKQLQKFFDEDKNADFLANLLLYLVNRTNRLSDIPLEINDIPLLAEADYQCPVCHSPLVDYVKTTAINDTESCRCIQKALMAMKLNLRGLYHLKE